MQDHVMFSVIVPLKKCNDFLEENVKALLKGSYKNFEIIILPDKKEKKKFPKSKIVSTGNVGPAKKRDIGAKIARGKILAFIDDDAYPSPDWLKNALKLFNKKKVAAVCGPGVTPPTDSVWQQASGAFSSVLIGGGPYTYRFIAQSSREVDDYPSMNFLIRKSIFWKVGGFDSRYWPGEDTKLCLDLTKIHKQKILYDPSVLVYHHRRAIFRQHLLQNGRYGLHRGYFAHILPHTSLRISYFLPSFLLLSFVSLPFMFVFNKIVFSIDLFLISLYLILVLLSSFLLFIQGKKLVTALLLIPTIVVTHLFYGIKFIEGFFFTSSLKT